MLVDKISDFGYILVHCTRCQGYFHSVEVSKGKSGLSIKALQWA